MGAAEAGRPRSSRGGSSRSNLAYDLGRSGEPIPSWAEEHPGHRAAFEDGRADRDLAAGNDNPRVEPSRPPADATGSGSTGDASRPPRGNGSARSLLTRTVSVPDSIGSAVAGGLLFAVGINYVRGGPAQVRQWMSAKFTNGAGRLP